jgi:hypothetical protein
MSSGSSGKRVIVPEPSRSMFCLMSRILKSQEGIWEEIRCGFLCDDFVQLSLEKKVQPRTRAPPTRLYTTSTQSARNHDPYLEDFRSVLLLNYTKQLYPIIHCSCQL